MRFLILSDLHANLQALDAVLEDARRVGYDEVLVLGDLVGYGADPGEVIDRTLALKPTALIRGNHDKVCAGLEPSSQFNDAARFAIEWTRSILSPAHLQVLAGLATGPQRIVEGLTICHGAPFDEDYYLLDPFEAVMALESGTEPVCFFGHTHVASLFTIAEAGIQSGIPEDAVTLSAAPLTLVNAGSVGQPRDGDWRAAYGLFETDTQTVQFRRVAYDLVEAQNRILAAGLPRWLADRLEIGR